MTRETKRNRKEENSQLSILSKTLSIDYMIQNYMSLETHFGTIFPNISTIIYEDRGYVCLLLLCLW